MTDEETLVVKAKELDPEAWSQIYRRHYQAKFAYAYRRLGNRTLAEDLAASVFPKGLEGIGKYKYRGTPLVAWLITMTRNLVADHFRRTGRTPQQPLDLEIVSKGPSPDQLAQEALQRERLYKALESLTNEQRQVVTLRLIDGLGTQEVGHLLNKSEGSIKALQHRAMVSLRQLLSEEVKDA